MCPSLVRVLQDQGNQTSVIKDDDEMEEEREGVETDYDGVLHHADVSCSCVCMYMCAHEVKCVGVCVYMLVYACMYVCMLGLCDNQTFDYCN